MRFRGGGWVVLAFGLSLAACRDVTVVVGKLKGTPLAAGSGGLGSIEPPPDPQAPDAGEGASPPIAGMVGDMAAGSSGNPGSPPIASGAADFELEPGTRQEFCDGHKPALRRVGTTASCAGGLTRSLFSYGLCACNDVHFEGVSFAIDSFDSRQGAYGVGQSGVAIGVNHAFATDTATQIRGSLTVAGADSISEIRSILQIDGDLRSRSRFALAGGIAKVGRDAWFDADLQLSGSGTLQIGRDLNLAPGRVANGIVQVGGVQRTSAVQIDPPCSCEGASRLDIAAIVARARMQNDNAEIQLQPDALRGPWRSAFGDVECGRFWLQGVSLDTSTVIVTIPGRTALFVEGDFVVDTATVGLQLDKAGEMDIFITGDLVLTGSTAVFGSEERPSALRLYVAGQTLLSGVGVLAAQLYAPNARLELAGIADMYGSVVGKDIHSSGSQRLHYDRAILANAECSDPAASCDDCTQCPEGLACIEGSCAACASDADCCAPMACLAGKCQLL